MSFHTTTDLSFRAACIGESFLIHRARNSGFCGRSLWSMPERDAAVQLAELKKTSLCTDREIVEKLYAILEILRHGELYVDLKNLIIEQLQNRRLLPASPSSVAVSTEMADSATQHNQTLFNIKNALEIWRILEGDVYVAASYLATEYLKSPFYCPSEKVIINEITDLNKDREMVGMTDISLQAEKYDQLTHLCRYFERLKSDSPLYNGLAHLVEMQLMRLMQLKGESHLEITEQFQANTIQYIATKTIAIAGGYSYIDVKETRLRLEELHEVCQRILKTLTPCALVENPAGDVMFAKLCQ